MKKKLICRCRVSILGCTSVRISIGLKMRNLYIFYRRRMLKIMKEFLLRYPIELSKMNKFSLS